MSDYTLWADHDIVGGNWCNGLFVDAAIMVVMVAALDGGGLLVEISLRALIGTPATNFGGSQLPFPDSVSV